MSVLRALLASIAILVGGVGALAAATDGFRAFTTETARRISVSEHPRTLPTVPLETSTGRMTALDSLHGRWLLVDFIYTSCLTYCSVQGSEFARLQTRLGPQIAQGKVALVSISFDPTHDGPAQLATYQRHSGDHGTGWIAARPTSAEGLAALMRAFGVTAIPDGLGGFIHNAAINVIDPQGRLVAIMDWNATEEAERFVLDGLAR